MNFFIGDEINLSGFTQVAPRLFLDEGWNQKSGIWYKGYSTECVIEDSIYDIVNGYQPAGKYCVICNDEIYHPVLRGFPVFQFEDNLTTLELPGYSAMLYDYPAVPKLTDDTLTIEEASYLIGDVLVENIENFYKYNNPKDVTLHMSSGLDTITCWTVHDQVRTDYNLVVTLSGVKKFIPDYTHDVMNSLTRTSWGHRQVTFKKQPSWSISGFYAEVYTYRDIGAATGYLNFLGKDLPNELTTEDDYYYGFLDRPWLVDIHNKHKGAVDASTPEKLKEHLWSTLWYDHQIWHLDNTMFFCPFADLRIPEIALRLPVTDLIKMGVNGDIQRHIINRFAPERLSLISKYKNEGKVWYNFKKNFDRSMIGEKTNFIVL